MRLLELLSPARDLECGIAAVNCGADAVYIGAPQFSARAAASVSLADIETLCRYAHRYGVRIYAALNTILFDDEVEPARRTAWDLYHAGVDALILQDMGLLEVDMPPMPLHASTQTDIRTPDKARFLERCGFRQIVLNRGLSLADIHAITSAVSIPVEAFVQGALCVSFNGRCYLSQVGTGRSANRGVCAQYCRLPYDLTDAAGDTIVVSRHLLSMKDLNLSASLAELADAGVSSFKIEGRLKDVRYVRNTTAYYRRALDALLSDRPEYARPSFGTTLFHFTPDLRKTFFRGETDYFLHGRKAQLSTPLTPKSTGEPVGRVLSIRGNVLRARLSTPVRNGDGCLVLSPDGTLTGFRVNRAEGDTLHLSSAPRLQVGQTIYRNADAQFLQSLSSDACAERRLALHILWQSNAHGYTLTLTAEDHLSVSLSRAVPLDPAQHPDRARAALSEGLSKLGDTIYTCASVSLECEPVPFLPFSKISEARREALALLDAERDARPFAPCEQSDRSITPDTPTVTPTTPTTPTTTEHPYPETSVDHTANVANRHARSFYRRHGVLHITPALEVSPPLREGDKPTRLLSTPYCIRYELGLCPRHHRPTSHHPLPWHLTHGTLRLTLDFDCAACRMHLLYP